MARFRRIASAIGLMLILSACGGGGSDSAPAPQPQTPAPPPPQPPPQPPEIDVGSGVSDAPGYIVPDGFAPGTSFSDGDYYTALTALETNAEPAITGMLRQQNGNVYMGPFELFVTDLTEGGSGEVLHLLYPVGTTEFRLWLLPGQYTIYAHTGFGAETNSISVLLGGGKNYHALILVVP